MGPHLLATFLLGAAVGCGAAHDREEGPDGGSDADSPALDAPPPTPDGGFDVTYCEEIFSARAGATCPPGLTCWLSDGFCLVRYAECPAGTVTFPEVEPTPSPPDAGCPDVGEVSLSGDGATAFTLESGVGSFSHGFAVDAQLIFFRGPDYAACMLPRLIVPLAPLDWGREDFYVGTHEVMAKLVLDVDIIEVPVSVRIHSHTPAHEGPVVLVGDLELHHDAIDLTGTFRITECRYLNRSGL